MSRFVSPNLSALGEIPALVDTDFETIKKRRADFLKAALSEEGVSFDVDALETSPLMIAVARGGGYEEAHYRAAINETIKKLSLATAEDGDLDHIGATYYGISRLLDSEGNPVDDATQRDLTALAPEAFSTAGPVGGYVFHALELDGTRDIADAWSYSEEDNATYSETLHADAFSEGKRNTPFDGRNEGDPVLAPEILLVILPTLEYGEADVSLLSRAYKAVTAKEVRPVGDNVRVEQAQIIDYIVDMEIAYAPGADPEILVNQARSAVEEYVSIRRRVGMAAQRVSIGGCGNISGIEHITLNSPISDVGGGLKEAPNCTEIKIVAVQAEGSWT